jgi:hypothetical protein
MWCLKAYDIRGAKKDGIVMELRSCLPRVGSPLARVCGQW